MEGDIDGVNAHVKSLSEYQNPEGVQLPEFAEFSPRFQAFRLFRTCMALQASQNYPRARRTFYDSLSWFEIAFDDVFIKRCQAIIEKYSLPKYTKKYTYEQIEQLKFMRIVWEFSVMLLDASTHNEVKMNVNPKVETELVPIGYAQIFNYEHMALELFLILTQIQRQQTQKDAIKFFNHSIAWFGGIFDAKFTIQGYIIDQTETNVEQRYRKLVAAFAKLLTRKSVMTTPFATLVYKPPEGVGTPKSVEEIVSQKKTKELPESDAVIRAAIESNFTGISQTPEGDTNAAIQALAAGIFNNISEEKLNSNNEDIDQEAEEIKAARLKQMEDQMDEMIRNEEDPEIIKVLDRRMENIRVQPAQKTEKKKITSSRKPATRKVTKTKTPMKGSEDQKPKEIKHKRTIFDLLPPEQRPKDKQ